MNSDYCYHKEMQRAMKRHDNNEARVIPIILRPVQWEKAPFSKLHVLPKDGKPVTSWENEEDAFIDIAQNIRKIIEETSSQHFKQNLEKTVQGYQKALKDAHKAGLNVCPECGNTNLQGEEQIDYAHDEIYHFIHCEECG
jgi:hypothetical protein